MKVTTTVYMAMSLNGMIAHPDDRTEWSAEDWKLFAAALTHHRIGIVGRRTYLLMRDLADIDTIPLMVVSKTGFNELRKSDFVVPSPHAALERCAAEGYHDPIIAGGAALNASFFEADLVDHVVVHVEPVLFSPGFPLCGQGTFHRRLELTKIERYGDNGIELHYRVGRQEQPKTL